MCFRNRRKILKKNVHSAPKQATQFILEEIGCLSRLSWIKRKHLRKYIGKYLKVRTAECMQGFTSPNVLWQISREIAKTHVLATLQPQGSPKATTIHSPGKLSCSEKMLSWVRLNSSKCTFPCNSEESEDCPTDRSCYNQNSLSINL